KRKVDGFIDFSKQVILGNKVFYVDCFGLKFPGWVRPEHIKTFLRNCFIPNSTKKAVDPSLSTASRRPTWPPQKALKTRRFCRRVRPLDRLRSTLSGRTEFRGATGGCKIRIPSHVPHLLPKGDDAVEGAGHRLLPGKEEGLLFFVFPFKCHIIDRIT